MAAKGPGLRDRGGVVATGGATAGCEDDPGVLARAERVVAADAAEGVEVDAGGGELNLTRGSQDVAAAQRRQRRRHRDALLSPLVIGDWEAPADLGVIAARGESNRWTGCLRRPRARRARARAAGGH